MRFDYGSREERDKDLNDFPIISGIEISALGLFRSLGNQFSDKTQDRSF